MKATPPEKNLGRQLKSYVGMGLLTSLVFTGCSGSSSSTGAAGQSSSAKVAAVTTGIPTSGVVSTVASTIAEFSWPASTVREPVTFTFSDGWKAKGEVDFPEGEGPFPTIVLLHGSGGNDMDQTFPGEPGDSKVFRQLAVTLTQRGFAVVRYNKRGVLDIGPKIEESGTIYTLTNYINDAKSVLTTTKAMKRVDASRIILLGHSEGTLTASVIANSDSGSDVAGLVLLGVLGRDVKSTLQFQLVDRTVDSLNTPDLKEAGVLTIPELLSLFVGMPDDQKKANLDAFQLTADPKVAGGYRIARTMDSNSDAKLDLEKELRPTWQKLYADSFPNLSVFGFPANRSAWLADSQTYGEVGSQLSTFTKPILMMNGEADTQTVVAGAREAFAKVKANPKARIELKTYAGLGHSFYPAKGLDQPLGPMQDVPLDDLSTWLVQTFRP